MSGENDADRREELSPKMQTILDGISIRTHGVDLERVQRIHLGLDSEPMEFSAETVAQMIQDVADNCDAHNAFILHAVMRALRGNDDYHSLTLQQKKRGRFEAPDLQAAKHHRRRMWLHWLAHLESQGVKTEAAITEIGDKEGVSRATVFAEIRKAERFLEEGRSIFAGSPAADNFQNPRPAKSGNE